MAIRFIKAELAFESPRTSAWQRRYKLLMIAGIVYAFLLSFLAPDRVSAERTAQDLLPPNWKAEPGNASSALSVEVCFQFIMVDTSATLFSLFMKFGMCHVFLCTCLPQIL